MSASIAAAGLAGAPELRPQQTLSGAYGQIATGRFVDDATLVIACGAFVHLVDVATGQPTETIVDAAGVGRIGVSGDGKTFALLDRSERLSTRRRATLDSRDTIEDDRRFSKIAVDDTGTHAISSTGNVGIAIDLLRGAVSGELVGHAAQPAQERGEYYDAASIYAVAISGDGSTAVTGATDATAIVWDVATCTKRHVLRGHDGTVLAVAIDRAARSVATIDLKGDVRTWDARSGRALLQHRFPAPACALVFDRAGSRLFVLLQDGRLVLLKRCAAGDDTWWQPVRTYALPAPYPYDVSLSIDPSDATLAAAWPRNVAAGDGWLDDSAVSLVTLATGTVREIRVPSSAVRTFALAPALPQAGVRVFAALARPVLWDLGGDGTPTRLAAWPPLRDAAYAPSGTCIAATGAGGTLGFYDLTGTLLARVASDAQPRCFTWSHAGDAIAASFPGRDADVVRIFARDGSERAHFGTSANGRFLAFARDGAIVAGGSSDITSYAPGSWKPAWRLARDVGSCVVAADAGRLFVSFSDRAIAMYDLATGAKQDEFRDGERVSSVVACSPGGTHFVTDGNGGPHLWSVARKRVVARFEPMFTSTTISGVSFTPDGSMLVFGSGSEREGGCASLFDLRDVVR